MDSKLKIALVAVLLCGGAMAQVTPNIGLNVPAFGTQNWNVLLNANFTKLDSLLSGGLPIPGMSINGNLTITGVIVQSGSATSGFTCTTTATCNFGNSSSFLQVKPISGSNANAMSLRDNFGNVIGLNNGSPYNDYIAVATGTGATAAQIIVSDIPKLEFDLAGSVVGTWTSSLFTVATPTTFGGKLTTVAPTTGAAGFNLPHGTSPTSPVNGDLWTTNAGFFAQINGTTLGPFSTSSGTGLSGMTAGQVPIAATASTVISSKALAGAGAEIVTGPNTSVSNDLACFTGTLGQLADCSLAKGNVVLSVSPGAGIAHFNGLGQTVTSSAVSLTADVSGNLPVTNLNSGTGATSSTFWRGDGTWGTVATSSAWSALTNPATSLSLTMGANTSTFNTTTAATQFFSWKNTTAAVVGTSQGSPVIATCGRAFTTIDVEDCMTFSELPGNGANAAITFTIGHTGASTGVVTTSVPGPLQTTSDGVHPSEIFFVGNTTNPSVSANTAGILGPPTATFTGYRLQLPSTGPVGTQTLGCGTPSSGVSTCTFTNVQPSTTVHSSGSPFTMTRSDRVLLEQHREHVQLGSGRSYSFQAVLFRKLCGTVWSVDHHDNDQRLHHVQGDERNGDYGNSGFWWSTGGPDLLGRRGLYALLCSGTGAGELDE